MKLKAMLFVLVLTSTVVSAQQAKSASVPLGTQLKVRWHNEPGHGSSVIVLKGGQRFEYPLGKGELDAFEISSAKLLSAKEHESFVYLLIQVEGPSRPGGSGMCGAGTETTLVWLKLNGRWEKVDSSGFLQESCFESIELQDEPEWDGPVYHLEVINLTSNTKYSVTYSYREPEKGLQITSQPAK